MATRGGRSFKSSPVNGKKVAPLCLCREQASNHLFNKRHACIHDDGGILYGLTTLPGWIRVDAQSKRNTIFMH